MHSVIHPLLLPCLLSIVVGQSNADILRRLPASLRQAFDSRKAQTSEIEWTVTHLDEKEYGLVERFVTRTSGDTVWQVNLGDENGFHRTTYHGTPPRNPIPKEENAGPHHALIFEGDLWYVEHDRNQLPDVGNIIPECWTNQDATKFMTYFPLNFETIGLAPWWVESSGNILGIKPEFLDGFEAATFETIPGRDSAMETVTATYGEYMFEWRLDRRYGGMPVYAAFYKNGELAYSSETELQEVDGRWIPTTVRFYLRDSLKPYKIIDVRKASFDKPWHHTDITPDDIGVLFGTQMCCGPSGLVFWDGTRKLTLDEYYELIYVYGVSPDPYIDELNAKSLGETLDEYLGIRERLREHFRKKYYEKHGTRPWLDLEKRNAKDEWDEYVEAFIRKHKLDQPRIKRAQQILKRAKRLRDAYIHRHIGEIRQAQRSGDTNKLARYAKHKKLVFDRVLVRGLKKLLPKRADSRLSSKP